MPNESSNPLYPFLFNRACQITESHCGPAVVQMLLSNLGISVTQEQVAEAGEAASRIETHGMRVDQLALAVQLLAPDAEFWYKDKATLEDLITLITEYKHPVGVEWQGVFDTGEDEDDESDWGHYSVIPYVDLEKKELIIIDPYKDFIAQDRIFSFEEFVDRWWDTNEMVDPQTGQAQFVEDYHMLFIITVKGALFPEKLQMKHESG